MVGYRSNLIDVEVEYQTHTDKAICVRNFHNNDVWIPLSMCEVDGDRQSLSRGDTVEITLDRSLAQEKELV